MVEFTATRFSVGDGVVDLVVQAGECGAQPQRG
jgi:hypothetical protein